MLQLSFNKSVYLEGRVNVCKISGCLISLSYVIEFNKQHINDVVHKLSTIIWALKIRATNDADNIFIESKDISIQVNMQVSIMQPLILL